MIPKPSTGGCGLRPTPRWWVCTSALPLGAVMLVASLAPGPGAAQPREVFRTSVDLVEIDVVALDRHGRPVLDLSTDDLEIFEDGQPVALASFVALRWSEVISGPVPHEVPAVVSAPDIAVAGNAHADEGRLVLIVIDQITPARFTRVRRLVGALLDGLGPRDQVAMISNNGPRAYQVEFTSDHARIARALEAPPVFGLRDSLLKVLTRAAEALHPIPRRKTVMVVSDGLPEIARSAHIGEENHVPDLRVMLAAAARASVAIYGFSPRLAGDLDEMVDARAPDEWEAQRQSERDGIAGLQTIAEATGGRAAVRATTPQRAIQRMLAESAFHYRAAYHSPAPRDGRFHRIEVRSRRPDVELRTRSGFVASKARPTAAVPVATVDRLLAAPVGTGGLPVRFIAVATPSRPRRPSAVHIVVEVDAAALDEASSLEVKALGVDGSGRVRASDRLAARIEHGDPGGDARWIRMPLALELRPGRYQLRVAAARVDNDTGGSAFGEVEVPHVASELAVGGLFVGTPLASSAARMARLLAALTILPSAAPHLRRHTPMRAGVTLQVPPRLATTALEFVGTVTGPDGEAREVMRARRRGAEFSTGGAFVFDLPLSSIDAGTYSLQLAVSAGRQSVRRTLVLRVDD